MNLNEYPLWTAIVTPMNNDGSVDYPSFEKLLREQEAAKNGILVLGSTGEALNIDQKTQKEILDFTLGLNLVAPLMVGVGGIILEETKSWVEYLNTLNVHAYLMVTPLYAKPGDEGQYEWFKALMDTANKPVMLYNVPSRTGKGLSHIAVQKLANHERLWAIKEASGSTEEFAKYVADAPNAAVYSGDDALLPAFSKIGAKGLVSVASNVWPEATHKYTRQNLENKFNDEKLWSEATNSLFVASNPIPAKVLLAKLGRISTPTLRLPLTDKDMVKLEYVLEQDKLINEWNLKN